jgi:hypothetical protein
MLPLTGCVLDPRFLACLAQGLDSSECHLTPTRPDPPASLTATPHPLGILLTWAGSANADGYVISRGTVAGGAKEVVATAAADFFVDDGVLPLVDYFYVVQAQNAGGTSERSNEASASWAPPGAPPAPTGLRVVSAGEPGVELDWDDHPQPVAGYRVYRATVAGGPYTRVGAPTLSRFLDEPPATAVTYFYAVTAVAGQESDRSAEVSVHWCPGCPLPLRRATRTGGVGFEARFTVSPAAGGSVRVDGSTVVGAAVASGGAFTLEIEGAPSLRGTWSSTGDFAIASGRATGTALVLATAEGGGELCLRTRAEYAASSGTVTVAGAFVLAGADAPGAGLLGSATFTGRVEADGTVVLAGRGRRAQLPATSCEGVDYRARLLEERSALAALEPAAAKARLRLAGVVELLDRALDPVLWRDGTPTSSAVLELLHDAVKTASAHAELDAATAAHQAALATVGRGLAEARYADAVLAGTAADDAVRHLDAAAAAGSPGAALRQALKAWIALG